MKGKRIIFIFGLFLAFFSVILGNLFLLSSNVGFAENVYNQTNFKLPVFNGRGTIYDFNLTPLTNTSFTNLVLALPGEQDYTSLFDFVKEEDKKTLYKALQTNSPCLVNLKNTNEDDLLKNAYIFKQPQRYQVDPIAEHLIGYVNSDGVGVSGIEFAFDEELKNAQDKTFVCCKTNARGALQVGEIPYLSSTQGTGQDVVLTIDDTIQRLCEAQAQQKMEKGSIVVIDVKTGRIKTSVSVPSFDPTNINKSIENGDTSLINRATCEFNVGSIFKPLLAAVALENGIDEKETYTC
ncbi:MAG: penicillin-binding transpeptidase domain-containing protein, partial [Oscillospiraceae bacterium]